MWFFRTPDGAEHSLRVYAMPHLAAFVQRERIALTGCARAGLPTPRIEAEGEAGGHPALVLSWRPGIPILSFVEKRPWTLWRLSRLFGRMQARLHKVDPPTELKAGAPHDWLALAGSDNQDLIDHALTLNLSTNSLIHMDYHPLNVVSDGRSVTGVVDWARAAAGDPRADLARTEITQLWAPIPPGPTKPLFEVLRHAMLRAWLSGYKQEAGALPDFRPLRAWAGATMVTEVEPVLGRPGVWGSAEDLARLRKMIGAWARQAGIR
jgi:aminoglycoside phosphotransferase (APT) family kinase protein